MGDVSAEPSMEDILSSIKRIIAEEEAPHRPRRTAPRAVPAPPPPALDEREADEVLELNDPVPAPPHAAAVDEPEAPAEPIVSDTTAQVTRGSLDALSRLLVKPEPQSDGTLEGLVRELLRPMLREWIDSHLPQMVEAMVAREIAKITNQR